MTRQPITIDRRLLAVEALKIMEARKITSVVVVDAAGPSKASCTCTISGARRWSDGADREHMTVEERARRIRLLLFDVDGVLTDGIVVMHADGSESKGFHIKDGAAIVWAQRAGLPVGLLSARASGATAHRAAQLAVRIVQQGVTSKATAFDQILRDANVTEDAVCIHGRRPARPAGVDALGLAAAPADAAEEVRAAVHWVSAARGGRGAVRELIELVLRAQGRWAAVVAEHGGRH